MKPKDDRLLILLADHDSDYRRTLSELLQSEGFRVAATLSFDETIRTMDRLVREKDPPALVISGLPVGDDGLGANFDDLADSAEDVGIPCIVLFISPNVRAFLPKSGGPEPILTAIKEIVQPSLSKKERT